MYAGMLPHRVRVLRPDGKKDRFGQPSNVRNFTRDGDGNVISYACRLKNPSGGQRNEERSLEVYVVRSKLFLELGTDIAEDDRVEVYDPATGQVLLTDGNVVLIGVPFNMFSAHHVEVIIEVTRGPVTAAEQT